MRAVDGNTLKHVLARIQSHFNRGISKQEAIGMSMVLHLALGLVFGAMYVADAPREQMTKEDKLVFELIPTDELTAVRNPVSSNSAAGKPNDVNAPPKLGKKMGSSESDSKTFVAEQANVDKQAVMMASLSNLVELRESFNFVVQQVSADSVGTFTPIQGSAPDTKYISDGTENGYGFGSRSGVISITGGGSGNCPPGGGDIWE